MNYSKIILFTLLSVSMVGLASDKNRVETNKKPDYANFFKKYGLSLATGATIGAVSGFACTKFQGPKPDALSVLISFFIANTISLSAINIAKKGLEEHNIQYDEDCLRSTERLTNWLVYLMV